MEPKLNKSILFFIIVIAGLCSLMYELLISTTSSYLLGDSVKQFSLIIGVYMAAMGIGSYFSKFLKKDLLTTFVYCEILLGILGGLSVPFLYFIFNYTNFLEFQALILMITFLIGMLTGLEVPLLIRFLKAYFPLKSNVAYVLGLDYIGALVATLIFPFLMLPLLGTFKTSIIFGLVNIIMGLIVYLFFTNKVTLSRNKKVEIFIGMSILGMVMSLIFSKHLLSQWEDKIFTHKVIYSKQTPYQNIVLTKNREELRLYINNIIQFSSLDEYRYHEALAHVPLCLAPYKANVLILGGGEALLAREVVKHQAVEKVTIVDLDKEMFKIAKENYALASLNEQVLQHKKVNAIVDDAMMFLQTSTEIFDIIIVDLPDPSNESLSRLYSNSFYYLLKNKLSKYGVFVTQASSVFHTNQAYWCIYETVKDVGFKNVIPYHVYVPSFGDWGYIMATDIPLDLDNYEQCVPSKYINKDIFEKMLLFENDIKNPQNLKVNKIDSPELLHYFLEDWTKWSKEFSKK